MSGPLLAVIEGVSLSAGDNAIMNIILVRVKERTGEDALHKALGATRESSLSQLLLESTALCSPGGLIGTSVGIGANLLAWLVGVPTVIMPSWVVLAFACAVLVEMAF